MYSSNQIRQFINHGKVQVFSGEQFRRRKLAPSRKIEIRKKINRLSIEGYVMAEKGTKSKKRENSYKNYITSSIKKASMNLIKPFASEGKNEEKKKE